ncbi:MAG: hypothetical protein M5U22_01345 [Thermoleophilia bacterium]|nr:hypothetical protein [Thermoleophilia bacterium]
MKRALGATKIWDAWKEVASTADVAASLVLAGDAQLMAQARAVLSPDGAWIRACEQGLDSLRDVALSQGETLLVFSQPREEDEVVAGLRTARLPAGAVVAVDDGSAATCQVTWYEDQVGRVSFADDEAAWLVLGGAVLDAAEEHAVALGRRYPGLRSQAAARVIRKTSRQNGVIGAAFILPGTDMPVMTLNQVKMVLSIAAIHGEEITAERALELLGVVGAGFGLRAIARQALDFVPGPGWALKGAIGYTGTRALGEAALRYFEQGAPATPSRLASLARRIRK